MEFFNKANAVKLRTHLDKYLIADDDQVNVRQSRHGGAAHKSRWSVELVPEKPHLVRLKSCHGRYLTASDVPFLLGMTGKKVLQTLPEKMSDWAIDWEPIRDGLRIKLRSWSGKYLRANGGPPPWRNSVTHDEPHTSATQKWVLWGVEVVEAEEVAAEWLSEYSSTASSFSSVSEDVLGFGSGFDSAMPVVSIKSPRLSVVWSKSPRLYAKEETNSAAAMELFHKAKAVRLKSYHQKYLLAHEDEESVIQDRNGSSKNARWTVEPVPGSDSFIRLKSAYNKYLTASNQPFLLGMTGNKVLQTLPRRPDSSVEWEPVREGTQVKLKTRYGQFLRANGGLPPWRNSVTHDIPHRTATQDWVLWDVDIVEIQVQSPAGKPTVFAPEVKYSDFGGSESSFRADKPTASAPPVTHWDSMGSDSDSPYSVSINSGKFSRQEMSDSDSYADLRPKSEGRTIYYHIADENGEVDDESTVGYPLTFKGNGVEELTQKLEEETGIEGIVVCTRSPLNKKLYPLHLQLPPNNTTMHVVIVQSLETGA